MALASIIGVVWRGSSGRTAPTIIRITPVYHEQVHHVSHIQHVFTTGDSLPWIERPPPSLPKTGRNFDEVPSHFAGGEKRLAIVFKQGVNALDCAQRRNIEISETQMAKIVDMSDRIQQFNSLPESSPFQYASLASAIQATTVPINRCTGEVYRQARAQHDQGLFLDRSTYSQADCTLGSDGDGAIARAERRLGSENDKTYSPRR